MNKMKVSDIVPDLLADHLWSQGTVAAQDFPEKPFPPRLVNDFAGMLNSQEINALEKQTGCF